MPDGMFFTLRVRYGSERRLHILYDYGAAPQSPKTDQRRIIRLNNIIIFYMLFDHCIPQTTLIIIIVPLVLILLIYAS